MSTSPPPYPQTAQFRLACFEFSLTFIQAAELPVYKGAIVHGALGLALARIGTQFRDFFYQPTAPAHWQDAHKSPPRPYLIIPPADDKTHYAAGDSLSLGIVLFGTAIDYFQRAKCVPKLAPQNDAYRQQIKDALTKNNDYKLLNDVRNALAHGTRSDKAAVQRALSSKANLHAALERLFNQLLPKQ